MKNKEPQVMHPEMFRDNPVLFMFFLATSIFLIGIILFLGWWIKVKNTKLIIDSNRDTIYYETGIFSKKIDELHISKIRNIYIYQSFFNRIFNVGKIKIYTSGDNPEIILDGFYDPKSIKETLQYIRDN